MLRCSSQGDQAPPVSQQNIHSLWLTLERGGDAGLVLSILPPTSSQSEVRLGGYQRLCDVGDKPASATELSLSPEGKARAA